MAEEKEIRGVRIVRIISETKRPKGERPRRGYRRVQAVVSINGVPHTRHGDTKDGEYLLMATGKKGYSAKPRNPRCRIFGCRESGTIQTPLGWFCTEEHRQEAATNIARVFVAGGLPVSRAERE